MRVAIIRVVPVHWKALYYIKKIGDATCAPCVQKDIICIQGNINLKVQQSTSMHSHLGIQLSPIVRLRLYSYLQGMVMTIEMVIPLKISKIKTYYMQGS